MVNYKILFNDDQDKELKAGLLKQLGFQNIGISSEESGKWLFTYNQFFESIKTKSFAEIKEITLPQLRDLVVLKRNDINDANWETEGGDQIFKDSNDKSYIYRSDGWDELQRHEMRQAMWEKPKAIAKPQDPALISGADALRALADGKEVEYRYGTSWESVTGNQILITAITGDKFEFRLKPQTIKVELELPKPFEPKDGDIYWFITCRTEKGYSCRNHKARHGDSGMQFGAYRTEAEVKQVVEQLRKIRGTNS